MSQFNVTGSKSFVANGAIGEGYAVKIASGKAVIATAATDKIIGVTENAIADGGTVAVRLRNAQGTSKVKLGGTVAVGDFVTSDAAGKLITTTTATHTIVGMALEAGVANDFIEIMNMTDRV
jgi:hypothetical protein